MTGNSWQAGQASLVGKTVPGRLERTPEYRGDSSLGFGTLRFLVSRRATLDWEAWRWLTAVAVLPSGERRNIL